MSATKLDKGIVTALAALTDIELDVTDVLARLVADFDAATGGGSAVAILALDPDDGLALLAATSHRAVELELLQSQRLEGPCVDAVRTGADVVGSGADELEQRWGSVGRAMVDAGFHTVHAFPMRWRGDALGGLNVFLGAGATMPDPDLGRAYADVATLAIVQSIALSHEQVHARLHEALADREVVEQAKGALAHAQGLDMEQAYRRLLDLADRTPSSLSVVARDVVRRRGALPE